MTYQLFPIHSNIIPYHYMERKREKEGRRERRREGGMRERERENERIKTTA